MSTPALGRLLCALLIGAISSIGCANEPSTAACFVWDASRSGGALQLEYQTLLRERVEAVAAEEEKVAGIVVKGDPRVEARVLDADFDGLGGFEAAGDRAIAVGKFIDALGNDVDEALVDIRNPSKGSGVIGGLDVLDNRGCRSIVVLSDALERSSDVDLRMDDIASPAARRSLIERLERRGAMPSLDGAELSLPFGGRRRANGSVWEERIQYVEPFWTEFAEAAGADLAWRR